MPEGAASFPDLPVAQQLAYAMQLMLGIVFVLSVVPKLRRPRAFAATVRGYQLLPTNWVAWVSRLLIVIESLLAVAFLSGWLLTWALPLAVATLLVFSIATLVNLRRGAEVPCGCFGNPEELVSRRSLVRLAVLVAAVVLVGFAYVTAVASPVTLAWLGAEGSEAISFLAQATAVAVGSLLVSMWLLNLDKLLSVVHRSGRLWPRGQGTWEVFGAGDRHA